MTKRETFPQAHAMLNALRSQIHRAEKAQRKAKSNQPEPTSRGPRKSLGGSASQPIRPLKPQREDELEGIVTDDYSLGRAHTRLREAVYNSCYYICSHAVQHARAEGFLEHDIIQVLLTGRVRAVYPAERRWLVCGYFESHNVQLPLHVVIEHHKDALHGEFLDVVTAFVPKQPHHIISRARLAVLLRYDQSNIQVRTAPVANKVGYKGKGKWRKTK